MQFILKLCSIGQIKLAFRLGSSVWRLARGNSRCVRGMTGSLYRCETDRHHTGWKWRGEKRRAVFLGGCCQCLCLCSFQTSLEMKDVLLLTTTPPPPPNSLHPLLLYLPLPSSLPDFSFTALIHFSQLFQTLFKVIIVWGEWLTLLMVLPPHFPFCHITKMYRPYSIRSASVLPRTLLSKAAALWSFAR